LGDSHPFIDKDLVPGQVAPLLRVARIAVPEWPHHVTQRGDNRPDVLFVDDDRAVYLKLLKAQVEVHGLKVLGHCLMTNHVHLVAVPAGEQSPAKAVGWPQGAGNSAYFPSITVK
jgi:REP element-mobilizing transposase RayT